MVNLLLSPHDDDSVLFAAYTCLRERPLVVVVTDSYTQPARGLGWEDCTAERRAAESAAAHTILGCQVERLGLRDDRLALGELVAALRQFKNGDTPEVVYVPALEGGHPHHDLTAIAAEMVFGRARLRCYSTYARPSRYAGPDLQPVGTVEVVADLQEGGLKMMALQCYASQMRVNGPHFEAVKTRSEWLSGYNRVNLGCGQHMKPGWMNLDRCMPPMELGDDFRLCDLADNGALRRALGANSQDYVFSEDVLEHLPPDCRVGIMNDIWHVLVPGGIMEHYVPNAGSRNAYGSPTHLSHWNLQVFEHFDIDSYRWKQDRLFEGIVCGFKKVSADLINWVVEEDGVRRAQSLRVRYRAVKPC